MKDASASGTSSAVYLAFAEAGIALITLEYRSDLLPLELTKTTPAHRGDLERPARKRYVHEIRCVELLPKQLGCIRVRVPVNLAPTA
jgi:hypothetical protein